MPTSSRPGHKGHLCRPPSCVCDLLLYRLVSCLSKGGPFKVSAKSRLRVSLVGILLTPERRRILYKPTEQFMKLTDNPKAGFLIAA